MISVNSPRFKLGQVVATPSALATLERLGKSFWHYISRHVNGDYGDLSEDDKQANEDALVDGSRILSSYILEGEGDDTMKLWIITEAEDDSGDRLATTLILADEY
jgi:hypothetical protein